MPAGCPATCGAGALAGAGGVEGLGPTPPDANALRALAPGRGAGRERALR